MSKTLALLALVASATAHVGLFGGGSLISRAMGAKPLGIAVGAINTVGGGIKETVSDIKSPIDQTITFIGSKQCSAVKRLVGVEYDRLSSLVEPDLDQVTLNLISDDVKASFKLTTLASSLHRTPGFDFHKKLVIFMHGFVDDHTLFAFPLVNEAFQTVGHYNVLGMDASPLIRFMYLRASTLVQNIGEKLGEALAGLLKAGLDPRDIHLIGHSLGSQIAGFAGKKFHALTGQKIGRISGLDPAGPCFSHVNDELRLNATDAAFVDVIHSNGGVYGIREAVGHVDYYPNGGEHQPNCMLQLCDHLRVVEFFAESIRTPDLFIARRCESWEHFEKDQCSEDTSLMGYGSRPGIKGKYYLRTEGAPPYALGARGLRARVERRRGLGNLGGLARMLI